MYTISRDTTGQAHEAIIEYLCKYGEDLKTENEEKTWELPEPLAVHVNYPLKEPRLSGFLTTWSGAKAQLYADQMTRITMRKGDGTDFSYTYGNRWFDFPIKIVPDEIGWAGDGRGGGINQVWKSVVKRLQKNPNFRRAVVCSWAPEIDILSNDPPCLDILQFFIRGNQLNLIVYIRSNDMLSAWGLNAFGLAHLMSLVAGELDVPLGYLETISASAHLYWARDAPELENFRRGLRI